MPSSKYTLNRVIAREDLAEARVVSLSALAASRAHLTQQQQQQAQAPSVPSEEDEARRAAAYEEGRLAGYQAGMADGLRVVEEERRTQLREFGARLARLADEFGAQARGLDHAFADEVVAVALAVARQVVRHELRGDRERIVTVAREAITALSSANAIVELRVHPSDADNLRELTEDPAFASRIRVVPDGSITAGGCRASAGPASVDATIETCWKNAVAALGSDEGWAAPTPHNDATGSAT
ncbi:MAG TPA: FliH/SctL family protein [Burkholderiaceae bacterium]|nr:FliH/SctL family protein [Burkholderiaceae bacterium]